MKQWKENSLEPDRFALCVLLITHTVNWVADRRVKCVHVYILCLPGHLGPALHMCTHCLPGRLGPASSMCTPCLPGVWVQLRAVLCIHRVSRGCSPTQADLGLTLCPVCPHAPVPLEQAHIFSTSTLAALSRLWACCAASELGWVAERKIGKDYTFRVNFCSQCSAQ